MVPSIDANEDSKMTIDVKKSQLMSFDVNRHMTFPVLYKKERNDVLLQTI